MSLVQHIADGELGEWFTTRGEGLRGLAQVVVDRAAQRHTVKPNPAGLGREHYAAVGGIVGQRLADLIEPAPPYPALLGAARCGALSLAAAGRVACTWPTHTAVPGEAQHTGVFIHPVPSGDYWNTAPEATGPEVDPDDAISNVIAYAAAEAGQRTLGELDALPVEAQRVPIYHALNLLESVYRGGVISPELHTISRTGEVRVPPEIVDDVVAVLAHQKPALAQQIARHAAPYRGRYDVLPATSLGHAAPVLVPQWAEADVLLGPAPTDGGFTLLDVKTVNRVDVDRVLEWLRQTLAYALLDTPNRWRIYRFGLWLPRQGMIASFPLDDGVSCLTGDDPRGEFLRLAWRAIRADGGDPSALLAATA